MAGWTVGIDVGGTKVLAALVDPTGRVAGVVRRPTTPGAAGVVGDSADVVAQLCAAGGVEPRLLAGVGLGVPGLVDPGTGLVTQAVNVGIDAPAPLGPLLSERLDGVPVVVENDLNALALGVAAQPGRSQDLAVLALGTGVAAGLVLDGRLRRGAFGGAGEIGHLPYAPDGPRCACGQHGCLELYASGAALDAAWPSRRGLPSPRELFEAAAAGDTEAVAVRRRYATAVAAAVRVLVLTTDVEQVLLGGGVSAVGPPLVEAVVEVLDEQAGSSPFLAAFAMGGRVGLVPAHAQPAALGAALVAGAATVAVPDAVLAGQAD